MDVFNHFPVDELVEVSVPAPLIKKGDNVEQIDRILKYIYHNQKIKSIKKEVTENNYESLVSQAYALKCDKLLKNLSKLNIKDLLKPTNAHQMYRIARQYED